MSAITLLPPPAVERPTVTRARHSALAVAGKIALVLLVAIVVSSCARRAPTPTSYGKAGSTIEKNFISGCTGSKNRQASDQPASHSTCECLWKGIKNPKTGIPFADFKKFNSELTNKNAPLPAVMQAIVAKCT